MTLCDATQYVYFLSPTKGGRQHDKKLADADALYLPAGSVLRQDLGLLGHAPAGVVVEMPCKKPPQGELTFAQKLYNHLLSPLRVVIEHAPSGSKRLRIVHDTGRLRGEGVRDLVMVMVVACGLHNLRVVSPHRAYRALPLAKLTNYSA
ncbi:MAG: transposase family protein [Janthinobacterium lividum]